jgi:hypothetical protein
MTHLARSVASLRITGDAVVPEEVSLLLGCEPSYAHRKGEALQRNSGVRIADFGRWSLKAEDAAPEDLDGQVSELLGQMTKDLGVWRSLASRFKVDLFCGWFMDQSNEGVSISSATLQALAERRIQLEVDIYGPGEDA